MALPSLRGHEGLFAMMSRLLVSLLAIVAGVFSHPASSATVAGRTYSPDRVPIKGALVTLASADGMVSETVGSIAPHEVREQMPFAAAAPQRRRPVQL